MEREDQSLVPADKAPRGEAGGKRPERVSQEALDAPAKWGGKHKVDVCETKRAGDPAAALREHSEEDTPVRRGAGSPARAVTSFQWNVMDDAR